MVHVFDHPGERGGGAPHWIPLKMSIQRLAYDRRNTRALRQLMDLDSADDARLAEISACWNHSYFHELDKSDDEMKFKCPCCNVRPPYFFFVLLGLVKCLQVSNL